MARDEGRREGLFGAVAVATETGRSSAQLKGHDEAGKRSPIANEHLAVRCFLTAAAQWTQSFVHVLLWEWAGVRACG